MNDDSKKIKHQRNTLQKIAIREVLDIHKRPLCIDEILTFAKERVPSLNIATVYRILGGLLEEDILIKLEIPHIGTFYELAAIHHHHHFYCTMCKRSMDLLGDCHFNAQVQLPKNFIAEHHEITVYGYCDQCSSKKAKS